MSTSTISDLAFFSQQLFKYLGISIFIAGILGGLLNVIVFLSLQTFRQNSCAFYLTLMSIVNIGQLITGFFSRIMISGFGIDWTLTSRFYCKLRLFILQICLLVSLTCMSLATIDQYLATCSNLRWQQWSNIKMARCLCAITTPLWFLLSVPLLIYYDQTVSPITGNLTCANTNAILLKFDTYFSQFFVGNFLPVAVTVFFGLLANRNVNQLAYRTVPLVRQQLDKQLTVMVLVQAIFTSIAIVPSTIMALLVLNVDTSKDPLLAAQLQFAYTVSLYPYYSYFASSFYIYVCASERFRRQLIYVLFNIYENLCRKQRRAANHVAPTV